MGAMYLAGKMEEMPKKLRDVINVFHHLRQKRRGRTPVPLDLSSDVRTRCVPILLLSLSFCQ